MLALILTLLIETVSASPFRVLVFPHRGAYPVPQGRESVVSKVEITSDEVCNQYVAQLNSNQEWVKSGDLIESRKDFLLSSVQLKAKFKKLNFSFQENSPAFYFECTKPFKVNRDSSLVSYSYEGNFVAIINGGLSNNMVQIVNLVEPEKYLQGVVPAEVGSGWPKEALKAQAVAARTFAWWTVLNTRSVIGSIYDLNDTIEFQAYSGFTNHSSVTDEAVSETSSQVLKYQGKIIKAYFSADSGGKTESAINAFGQTLPYCISKQEQYVVSDTQTSWEYTIPLSQIASVFSKNTKKIEIEATDINESGRVSFVTLISSSGKKTKVPGTTFRKILKLRSTLFNLQVVMLNSKAVVQISGKGYGHGVGMAQVGAKEYALQLGWTFDQIVKFYYTDTTLESVMNEYIE